MHARASLVSRGSPESEVADVEVRSREAAGTVSKPLDVDTLYEQQSSTQRIPGDIACWGVFR
jgi:hypothetical protein